MQDRYAAYATPVCLNRIPRIGTQHCNSTTNILRLFSQTHELQTHRRLDSSLNAHVVTFCTFARHSWTALLSKIAGAANEN